MTNVRIVYNHITHRSCLFIDGKPVPEYSTVSHFLNLPFCKWYREILPELYNEVMDTFSLEFVARPLEYNLLKSVQADCPKCVELKLTKLPLADATVQRLQFLSREAPDLAPLPLKVQVYCDRPWPELSRAIEQRCKEIPLCVPQCWFQTLEELEQQMQRGSVEPCDARFLFLREESPRNVSVHRLNGLPGNTYLFYDSAEKLSYGDLEHLYLTPCAPQYAMQEFGDWLDYEALPTLLARQLGKIERDPSTDVGLKLCMLDQVDAQTFVLEVPEVELGCNLRLETRSVGENAPSITLTSSVSGAVQVYGNELRGVGIGTSHIEGRVPGNPAPVCSFDVKCIKRNRIQQILLEEESLTVEAGDSFSIGYSVYPKDADNMDRLEVRSSDPSVLYVDEDTHEIIPQRQGFATVIITAEAVQAQCRVEVKPRLEALVFDPYSLTLYIDQTEHYSLRPEPEDVLDQEYEITTTGRGSVRIDRRRHTITGVNPGNVDITATNKDGSVKGCLKVTVKKPFNLGMLTLPAVVIGGVILIAFVFRMLFG